MSGHTPGPWDERWAYSSDGRILLGVEDWQPIARVTRAPILIRARLIAAAPDLLAACEQARAAMGMHGPCKQHSCRECRETWDALRAAIQKAKGEA